LALTQATHHIIACLAGRLIGHLANCRRHNLTKSGPMPMNFAKTGLLLAAMTGIFVAMGALLGGTTGMVIAFVLALGMNAFSLWQSDKMVLRLYGAEEVDANSGGQYYAIVADLARKAGLPMPRVYIMHNPQPNAFATGRNHANAAVCASTGLIEMLSADE